MFHSFPGFAPPATFLSERLVLHVGVVCPPILVMPRRSISVIDISGEISDEEDFTPSSVSAAHDLLSKLEQALKAMSSG